MNPLPKFSVAQKRFLRELFYLQPPGAFKQYQFYNLVIAELGNNLNPDDSEVSAAARRVLQAAPQ
jgi:hypothetical protein